VESVTEGRLTDTGKVTGLLNDMACPVGVSRRTRNANCLGNGAAKAKKPGMAGLF
jgi:hypothetical protein